MLLDSTRSSWSPPQLRETRRPDFPGNCVCAGGNLHSRKDSEPASLSLAGTRSRALTASTVRPTLLSCDCDPTTNQAQLRPDTRSVVFRSSPEKLREAADGLETHRWTLAPGVGLAAAAVVAEK